MTIFLLQLLLAHAIGDFVLQPDAWVKHKRKKKHKSPYLYAHIALHLVSLLVVLQLDWTYWPAIGCIITSHYIIDVIKLHIQRKRNERRLFIADQIAHLIVIFVVAYAYYPFPIEVQDLNSLPVIAFLFSIIFLTSISAVVMRVVMSKWRLEDSAGHSLEQAGKYIGILERLFVFGFIVLGQFPAIGLLITAKSVFRFGDLSKAKDRKLTEYVLIGTLLSFGLAIIMGLTFCYLVGVDLT